MLRVSHGYCLHSCSVNVVFCTDIMDQLNSLTLETDLKKSEIRLFCDDDKRWGDERPTGGWYDKTKYVRGT